MSSQKKQPPAQPAHPSQPSQTGQPQPTQQDYQFEQRPEFVTHINSLPRGTVPRPRPVRFKDYYDLKEELGTGSYGIVRRCVTKGKGEQKEMAAKVNNSPEKASGQLLECEICAELSIKIEGARVPATFMARQPSRYVLNLFDAVAEGEFIYNIYEIASGGDLQEEIERREFFTVDEARDAFRQIIKGVHHMHERGWLHSDLKPQNILIEHRKRKVYKVADFGCSVRRNCTNMIQQPPPNRPRLPPVYDRKYGPEIHGRNGTYMYFCPQKFAGQPYDVKSDWWSCACILYQMLAGAPPFTGDYNEIQTKIQIWSPAPNLEYKSPEWNSPNFNEAKALLTRIFVNAHIHRPDYSEICNSDFLDENRHPPRPLPPLVTEGVTLKDYNGRKLVKINILRKSLGLPEQGPDGN